MKSLARILGIAIIVGAMGAAGASPAVGWYVDTGDCESQANGKIIEPFGDPWARVAIRNVQNCEGWVRVPDKSWVRGGTFYVTGTDIAIGRGERAWLAPGSYRGTWSNTSEVERFTIRDTAGPVTVGWSYVGRHGRTVRVYTVPQGCVFRSGYQWVRGGTMTKLWDRTDKVRLAKLRVSPPGFYKPLAPIKAKGLTCEGSTIA